MSEPSLILLPILIGLGFLYWASQLENDPILQFIFRLFFIPSILLSVNMGLIFARLSYAADTELISLLADLAYYVTLLLYGIGVYYLILIMGMIRDIWLQKKADKGGRNDSFRHGRGDVV